MMRRIIRPAVVLAAVAGVLAGSVLAIAESRPPGRHAPAPKDGRQAVLAAFDEYRVVGLMSPVVGSFAFDLVADRGFPDKVDDIVVECGNALYQPVLDRYIAGEDVPLAEVRHVWRDTTQPSCGYSSFYETLLALVRRVNETLPPAKKLRVLAADPPVDWATVRDPRDLEPFRARDPHIASVVRTEVLAKNRKALLLFGLRHLMHGDGDNAVALYEKDYPGATYVVAYHRRFEKDNEALEARLASWPVPSLLPIKGTWLGDLDATSFPLDSYQPAPGERGYPGVDAYLYLGRRDVLLREHLSARTVLDEDYLAELNRRADLKGMPADGPMRPAAVLRREAEAGVLLYDPGRPR
ncbi:hypothetical protein [Actinophytocola sp.]|jgi:hypothetical protein|uniref:hypothetical protein n=1 Tax=Actinophytocola sp. TaxID=1872138 RepID=UPI002EDAE4AB